MRCPSCGFDNPAAMRFCGQCGTGLTTASAGTEERKLVTVLFADVVGSTHLSRTVDPERIRVQMAQFFRLAQEEIQRYGGTVEKFIGDAVMAVFGLPAIHEDDPERAARAALAIQGQVRSAVEADTLPQIRIGINTGEVVANATAAEKGEFFVTGEVVNLAARLQERAEPGQVLVGDRTMRALRRIAQMHQVPALAVKGAASPLPAWELLKVAPPQERTLGATPFVGRVEELELLRTFVQRIRREGRGHVITILGSAGVGKTRLVQEFRAQTDDVRVLRGRALPYGTGVPFWALSEAIREECGILMGDPLEVAQRKLQDATTRLEVTDTAPALHAVLGLGGEGRELSRQVLFSSLRAFFQAIAHRMPLMLILEDIHLAEDVTLDYIEHAAEWIREVPLLLLVLSRPELLERRGTWMGGKRSATSMFLEPLAGEEGRALTLGILGGKAAPDQLLDLVLERAEGNPLFMEEMLRALIERSVLIEEGDRWQLTAPLAQVAVPDTVHAVIAARIDALPGAEKQVLQTAAVVGKDFWLGALRFIAGEDHIEQAIQTLVGKDVLLHKRRSTLVGEDEFTFRHILIRDVAYAMLPKVQRVPRHTRCAEWLRQIAGDRPAEYADFIAHHWLQVVTLCQDLGVTPDVRAHEQATANLLLAGDRAAGLYANATALDHYSRALDLQPDTTSRLRALLGRGEVWMLLGQYERARDDFAAIRALADESGQPRWAAVALDHLGHSFRRQDQVTNALEHLEPALALSRQVGDLSLTGRILNHIGFTYFSAGRHAEALRAHSEARRLLEASHDIAGLVESLHGLGENLWSQGQFEESIHWLEESTKTSDQLGNRSLASENRFMIAYAQLKLGNYAQAQAEAGRSVTTLAEIGDIWNYSIALPMAAMVAVTMGEGGRALEYGRHGLDLARQIGAPRFVVWNLLNLGVVHREMEDYHGAQQVDQEAADISGRVMGAFRFRTLASLALDAAALGRCEDAERLVREARQVLEGTEDRLDFPCELTHTEGRVSLSCGKATDAKDKARALLEMVATSGISYWQVLALLLWADATVASNDPEAAIPRYTAGVEESTRLRRAPVLWRALAGLADAQQALGRFADAATSARSARDVIDRLADNVADARIRAVFLQSRRVQRVMTLASGR